MLNASFIADGSAVMYSWKGYTESSKLGIVSEIFMFYVNDFVWFLLAYEVFLLVKCWNI